MKPLLNPKVSSLSTFPALASSGFDPGRRAFLRRSAALAGGCAFCLHGFDLFAARTEPKGSQLLSPGCRRSKVRVAKVYLGKPKAHWPTPTMDLETERRAYEAEFVRQGEAFADVDFIVNELVTEKAQLEPLKDRLKSADGILAIHLSMGMKPVIEELMTLDRPMALYAAPYSGHEWSQFGELRKKETGKRLECFLTSDRNQLAVAVRPFRALHHMREAKVLNVIDKPRDPERIAAWTAKFGTEFKAVDRERMLAAYEAVPLEAAEAEAKRWIRQARKVVEPSRDEILRSCRLALAFENLLAEEDATVITVDCYGSMYRKLPAFPCVGFVRLNGMGLGGICESDLTSAMVHILLQGLSGRPGFISDPTMDESTDSIVLAHCLGSTKMDGPNGKASPYRLRSIMERQEGCVPQVFMRVGQKVTQAWLTGPDQLLYFTGNIVAVPDTERGCRTKITVRVDGSPQKLWQNWSHGLHRVTCYGDLTEDLQRFCRYKDITMANEA